MITTGLFTSNRGDWETPDWLFDRLNEEFSFSLDPSASDANHRCEKYYTAADDGLSQNWGGYTVFCNPPYGKQLAKWVRKAYEESRKPNTTIVLLIPARTDTQWFHDYIYGTAEIRFIKGRIKFKGAMYNAPFPSMIVIYRSADCAGKEK